MLNTEELLTELKYLLSNANHPIEGIFYLFILALIFRWRWPLAWNSLLKSIAASEDRNVQD